MFRSTLAMAALCIVSIAALSGIAMADNHGNDNDNDSGAEGTHHVGTDPPGYCYAEDIQSCRPGDKILHAYPAPPVDPEWAKKHH